MEHTRPMLLHWQSPAQNRAGGHIFLDWIVAPRCEAHSGGAAAQRRDSRPTHGSSMSRGGEIAEWEGVNSHGERYSPSHHPFYGDPGSGKLGQSRGLEDPPATSS